jgi:hypothetical protein
VISGDIFYDDLIFIFVYVYVDLYDVMYLFYLNFLILFHLISSQVLTLFDEYKQICKQKLKMKL